MNTQILSQLKKRRSAFTLIEIMVASVIMVVLVGLVIQITSEVLNVWNRSSGKLAANAEARIAMDLLTQDLETAVFRNNKMRWIEAEEEPFQNPLSGSGFVTTKLKLFSPALDRPDGPGDICGIAYLLNYRNPIDGGTSGDQTFVLYRHLIDPEITFNDLMGESNQESFDNTQWSDDSIRDNGKNYLVSNIVDFRVDFYVVDDGDSATTTQVAGNILYGGTSPTVGPGASVDSQASSLAYAEITLTVISDEALKVIQNNAYAQSGFDTLKDYIVANSETFTRRVNLLARPL